MHHAMNVVDGRCWRACRRQTGNSGSAGADEPVENEGRQLMAAQVWEDNAQGGALLSKQLLCHGVMVFSAGWALKFIMITRAAYNQGFAFNHTSVRGSGLPGGAVKPRWAL